MKILVSGCSFSTNWPNFLSSHLKNAEVTNLSFPGAGNKYIADSIIAKDLSGYDIILVMWSGLTRLDIPITSDIFDDYDFKKTVNDQQYIMSGGLLGSWLSNHFTKILFEGTYKFITEENMAMLSILEMIKLQNFLNAKNKKFIFSSYVNYWNQSTDWKSPNADFSLSSITNIDNLLNKIEFDKWLFLDENRNGIYEYAITNSLLSEDMFHPNESANEFWAHKIIEKIKEIYVTN